MQRGSPRSPSRAVALRALVPSLILLLVVTGACAARSEGRGKQGSTASPQAAGAVARPGKVPPPFRDPLPGMPPAQPGDVYAAARPGPPQKRVASDPAYLYVPNSFGAPITTVIDQRTHKVVRRLHTGYLSQHVTPSYDLRTLYVEASESNRLVAIDPHTGKVERRIPQPRPYNLYFTPDGRHGVVMAEQDDEVVFTDPHTFRRQRVVHDPRCLGPNHADYTANGRFLLVSCEFSGTLLRIDVTHERVAGLLRLPGGAKPQDVRLAPDGRSFWVADMGRNRLLQIPWNRLRIRRSLVTPEMPHGVYPSRDGRFLFVTDRMAGAISVVNLARHRIVHTWPIPGGTPDMGGLSADGRTLWLSGRNTGEVYGVDTRTGRLTARLYVGGSPHGILVWPQPGRYSLGHTGNMR